MARRIAGHAEAKSSRRSKTATSVTANAGPASTNDTNHNPICLMRVTWLTRKSNSGTRSWAGARIHARKKSSKPCRPPSAKVMEKPTEGCFSKWNEQCEPPWSEKDLLHKLQDALKQRHRF